VGRRAASFRRRPAPPFGFPFPLSFLPFLPPLRVSRRPRTRTPPRWPRRSEEGGVLTVDRFFSSGGDTRLGVKRIALFFFSLPPLPCDLCDQRVEGSEPGTASRAFLFSSSSLLRGQRKPEARVDVQSSRGPGPGDVDRVFLLFFLFPCRAGWRGTLPTAPRPPPGCFFFPLSLFFLLRHTAGAGRKMEPSLDKPGKTRNPVSVLLPPSFFPLFFFFSSLSPLFSAPARPTDEKLQSPEHREWDNSGHHRGNLSAPSLSFPFPLFFFFLFLLPALRARPALYRRVRGGSSLRLWRQGATRQGLWRSPSFFFSSPDSARYDQKSDSNILPPNRNKADYALFFFSLLRPESNGLRHTYATWAGRTLCKCCSTDAEHPQLFPPPPLFFSPHLPRGAERRRRGLPSLKTVLLKGLGPAFFPLFPPFFFFFPSFLFVRAAGTPMGSRHNVGPRSWRRVKRRRQYTFDALLPLLLFFSFPSGTRSLEEDWEDWTAINERIGRPDPDRRLLLLFPPPPFLFPLSFFPEFNQIGSHERDVRHVDLAQRAGPLHDEQTIGRDRGTTDRRPSPFFFFPPLFFFFLSPPPPGRPSYNSCCG